MLNQNVSIKNKTMGVVVLVALFCFFTVSSGIDPYQFVF